MPGVVGCGGPASGGAEGLSFSMGAPLGFDARFHGRRSPGVVRVDCNRISRRSGILRRSEAQATAYRGTNPAKPRRR